MAFILITLLKATVTFLCGFGVAAAMTIAIASEELDDFLYINPLILSFLTGAIVESILSAIL
jgi:hypothetical protein